MQGTSQLIKVRLPQKVPEERLGRVISILRALIKRMDRENSQKKREEAQPTSRKQVHIIQEM